MKRGYSKQRQEKDSKAGIAYVVSLKVLVDFSHNIYAISGSTTSLIVSFSWVLARLQISKVRERHQSTTEKKRTSSFRWRFSLPAILLRIVILWCGTCRALIRFFRLGLGLLLCPGAHTGTRVFLAVGAEPFAVRDRIERWVETLQMPRSITLDGKCVRLVPAKVL